MSERLTEKRLAELRATVPHAKDIDGIPDLTPFAAPNDQRCLNCEEWGTFTWGLAHGEGHCSQCGWPARLYHFVKTEQGEQRIVSLLQYHPDEIQLRNPPEQ